MKRPIVLDSYARLCLLTATSFFIGTAGDLLAQLLPTAQEPAAKTESDKPVRNEFLRLKRDETGNPLSLQTAITTYRPEGRGDLRVDLVGAVHVGDKEYYQQLNREFEKYDAVLYELVAPQGTVVPKGGRRGGGGNPVSMLQDMTKNMLNLASQMEEVDYTKRNFVHADMSPAEMQESLAKRGETPVTVALDTLSEMMKQQNLRQQQAVENNEPLQQFAEDPFSLLFDPQRDTKLKLMMAEQFATMGTDALGNTMNRVLVEDRNKAAMRVFSRELTKGSKRIAIFYGAAHLPDFEKRLEEDFGLKRAETKWVNAWDLTKPSKHDANDPVDSLFRTLLSPR